MMPELRYQRIPPKSVYLHKCIDFCIWENTSLFFSLGKLHQHLYTFKKSEHITTRVYNFLTKFFYQDDMVTVLTISCTNSLTLSREIECFSNGQFSYVQIMLADVRWGLLGYKLMESMPIVCDTSFFLLQSNRYQSPEVSKTFFLLKQPY